MSVVNDRPGATRTSPDVRPAYRHVDRQSPIGQALTEAATPAGPDLA